MQLCRSLTWRNAVKTWIIRKSEEIMVASKWTILLLCCAAGFGAYYSFETPSVLHNAMFRHYNVPDKAQFELYFSLIYSLYALPNMFIPLVGGMMADRFGNKTILLVFSAFILIGSAIETFACFQRSMVMFLIGRFVFGCGAETLNVCMSIVISKWFKGQELALALAINLSLSKLATVVTDWTSPLMYRIIGIKGNAVFVTSLCLLCYLLTIWLTKLDTDDSDHAHLHSKNNSMASLASLVDLEHHVTEDIRTDAAKSRPGGSHVELTQLTQRRPKHHAESSGLTESAPLLHKSTLHSAFDSTNSLNYISIDHHDHHVTFNPERVTAPAEEAALPTYLGFSIPVWIILLFTLVMYGTFIPFTNWSTVIILQFYFNAKNQTAAYVAYSEITAARYLCCCIVTFYNVLSPPTKILHGSKLLILFGI